MWIRKKVILFTIFSREVTYEEGEEYASKHYLDFIETSSKSGHNIKELFFNMAEKIYEKI